MAKIQTVPLTRVFGKGQREAAAVRVNANGLQRCCRTNPLTCLRDAK